jgi:hypothetical protein
VYVDQALLQVAVVRRTWKLPARQEQEERVMSAERRTPALTEEQINYLLQSMAGSFGQQPRSPIVRWPS